MFPATLTPHVVSTEAIQLEKTLWRMVEAQHERSTMKLVDSPEEHNILEDLLETSKPKMPDVLSGLHYLLATPFRYPTRRGGSRFRSAKDPGVFYGAGSLKTACAELAYWRWRFLIESIDLEKIDPVVHTAFTVPVSCSGIYLSMHPFVEHKKLWMDPRDYTHTQKLAAVARAANLDAIVYPSVRDQPHGWCVALLNATGFASKAPDQAMQTWHITVSKERVYWRKSAEESFVFEARELSAEE